MKTQTVIPKKYRNIFGKRFQIGFECEFILRNAAISYDAFRNMCEEIHPEIELGWDSSIYWDEGEVDGTAIELRTPPLPSYKSLLVLYKVFTLINKYGFTNETCGLHASFSPLSEKIYYKIDPYKVLNSPLWGRIKKDFRRENNEYCEANPLNFSSELSPLKLWKGVLYGHIGTSYDGHISDVNFDNYHDTRRSDSRIEIRCMGNTNYQRRFSIVAKHIHSILQTLKNGYGIKR